MGAINTLGLAKRVKATILQASTSEVYGDPEVHPQREDYWGRVNPIGIRSCYDEGKRAAECLMMDYHRQNQVDVKIVRIFNTYGPRMAVSDGRVVSNFIVQALKGEEITVYGDGDQTRSFCYVDDLVEGLIRMMNSEKGFTGPVNIGTPREFTILELAEDGDPDDRLRLPDRLSTASPGRSGPATAGHHPGQGKARLGAPGAARRRTGKDDRLFSTGALK